MKITDIRVLGNNLPMSFVEVETDEGVTGIGCAATAGNVISSLIKSGPRGLSALLIGEDPLEIGRLWRKMFVEHLGVQGGLVVNAMGAIDTALWDIAGKKQGLPLYKLLGGPVQNQVMAYASASAFRSSSCEGDGPRVHKSAEELVEESKIYLSQGFKAMKYGWGNYFRPEDEEKLAAIREAIGPTIRLMLDFGCPAHWSPGWNAKDAIRAGRILEKYDLYFWEEPLPPFDVEGHAAVTHALNMKIATGEYLTTTYEFQRFIDQRAVDIVQPDIDQMGVSQVYQVARAAQAAGILCIPHGPWSALTVSAHLNILASVANGPMVEYPAFASFEEGSRSGRIAYLTQREIVEDPPVLEDGFLRLPTSPGLGLGGFVADALSELESLTSPGGE